MTIHGKRAHFTHTIFSAFFYTGVYLSAAQRNDANGLYVAISVQELRVKIYGNVGKSVTEIVASKDQLPVVNLTFRIRERAVRAFI